MQRPRLELGVGLLLSHSPSLYPSLSPSSEIFHSSLPFSLCPAGTIGFIRIAATPSPPKVAPPAKNAKARLNPEKRIPLVSSGLAAPRACPPAHSLARSLVRSAPLRSSAREERGWTTAHWDRPLHRNRIRDAFVTYRGRVQVNAIRPIDFYLPPPLCPFRRVSFVEGSRGLVTRLR